MKIYINLLLIFCLCNLSLNCSDINNSNIEYYSNGNIKKIYKFKKINNKKELINSINYDISGDTTLIEDFFYKTKQVFFYHDNGKLKYSANYKNNKLHGNLKEWYNNGQLKFEYIYENGYLKDGEYNEFDSSGNIIKKLKIKNSIAINDSSDTINNKLKK